MEPEWIQMSPKTQIQKMQITPCRRATLNKTGAQTLGAHTLQPRISDLANHLPGGGQMLGAQTLGAHTLQPRISDLANHLPGGGQMLGAHTLGAHTLQPRISDLRHH